MEEIDSRESDSLGASLAFLVPLGCPRMAVADDDRNGGSSSVGGPKDDYGGEVPRRRRGPGEGIEGMKLRKEPRPRSEWRAFFECVWIPCLSLKPNQPLPIAKRFLPIRNRFLPPSGLRLPNCKLGLWASVGTGLMGQCGNWAWWASVETGLMGQAKLDLWVSVGTGLMGQCRNWAYGPMWKLGLVGQCRNWAYGPELGLWANVEIGLGWPVQELDLWTSVGTGLMGQCRNWAYGPTWKLGLWGQAKLAYGPTWKLGLWANMEIGLDWAFEILKLPAETGLFEILKLPAETGLFEIFEFGVESLNTMCQNLGAILFVFLEKEDSITTHMNEEEDGFAENENCLDLFGRLGQARGHYNPQRKCNIGLEFGFMENRMTVSNGIRKAAPVSRLWVDGFQGEDACFCKWLMNLKGNTRGEIHKVAPVFFFGKGLEEEVVAQTRKILAKPICPSIMVLVTEGSDIVC
ncbi:hypothetical protein V8G54_035878 [Vigna mungo]|uniref:Uncharacterized protein n=1 Tax=Vigna mungo TaxID=3915 RepID=A0AAQ3MG38_VIGMU